MNSLATSGIVFACVFGGAMAGPVVRGALPPNHLSADSKEVVKLGMGLVATMSALVLGLLVSSAKGFYDAQSAELTEGRVLGPRAGALWARDQRDARSAARRCRRQSR
jgi:hypothetical protein